MRSRHFAAFWALGQYVLAGGALPCGRATPSGSVVFYLHYSIFRVVYPTSNDDKRAASRLGRLACNSMIQSATPLSRLHRALSVFEAPASYGKRFETALEAEIKACLCLKHTPGLGLVTAKRLLTRWPSARAAVQSSKSWRSLGLIGPQAAEHFTRMDFLAKAQEEWRGLLELDAYAVCFTDPRYPARLREIPDPPLILYCVGDLKLLHNPAAAVVGSRRCSSLGLRAAAEIAGGLSRAGVTVVSGLAAGIDAAAHEAALSGIGSTIAVLGTAVDQIYPPENRRLYHDIAAKGLIVTEYAKGCEPLARNFPMRNRIVSGLSLAATVIDAGARSGALITASRALDQGREVFAFAGNLGGPQGAGSAALIEAGAAPIRCAEDILLELKPQLAFDQPTLGSRIERPKSRLDPATFRPAEPPRPARRPQPVAQARRTESPPPPWNPAPPSAPPPARTFPRPAVPTGRIDAEAVLDLVKQAGEIHIDDIAQALGVDPKTLSSILI